ncbi:hypothetical protein ACNIU2_26675, partial [Escherichia coli]
AQQLDRPEKKKKPHPQTTKNPAPQNIFKPQKNPHLNRIGKKPAKKKNGPEIKNRSGRGR